MDRLDDLLRGCVLAEKNRLHNAAFAACGRRGKTLYADAYGTRDLGGAHEVSLDSVYWIASLTKLSTAVAVMIAVEKGLVGLDDNVRELVPELAELDILEGFDQDGAPLLRRCTGPITLRQLLSHSSGFCYDAQHEGLKRWSKYVGRTENTFSGTYKGYLHPLVFEPGCGWSYGPGMDWAGRTVEAVSGDDLEAFMQKHIWGPLSMDSTTFRPEQRPDLMDRLVSLAWRNPDGSLALGKVPLASPASDCCGGVGLYSTPADQAKLLSALLDDALLKPSSMDEILEPQLADNSHFLEVVCGSRRSHLGQTWPEGATGSFGLSSSINRARFPGRRGAHSANWQGMPGIHAFPCRFWRQTLGGLQ